MDNRNQRRTIKPVKFDAPVQQPPEPQSEPQNSGPRRIGGARPIPQPAVQKPAEPQPVKRTVQPAEVEEKKPSIKEKLSKTLDKMKLPPKAPKTPKAPAEGKTQRIAVPAESKTRRIALPGKQKQPRGVRGYEAPPAENLGKSIGKRTLRASLMVVIALVVVCALGLFVYKFAYGNFIAPMSSDPNEKVEIIIDKSDSLKTIAQKLEDAGVIRNSTIFKYYVDFSDMSTKLLAGKFEVSPSMTYDEIINVLKRPAAAQTSTNVMLVEGILNKEMVTKLENEGVFENAADFQMQIDRGDQYSSYWFVKEVLDAELDSADKRDSILEGYLFPDTYNFYIASDEKSAIEKMLNRFDEIYTDDYKARAEELGMTTDEVVTLASIIQKEAGKVEDFKKVSAVFHNRLDTDMMLQSCATLQYFMPEKKFVYSAAETKTPSPYNTYIHAGLPVGPICNPGKDAIEAALWPDESFVKDGYLYFCAADPAAGTTVFAKTYEEHQANVAKYEHLW